MTVTDNSIHTDKVCYDIARSPIGKGSLMSNDSSNRKYVNPEYLIGLFNAGHKKLVPISMDGKIPQLLTKEDILRIKNGDKTMHLRENDRISWFTFIDDNPDFWTEDKLSDPHYSQKFNNVAKITGGGRRNNGYELVLDIDSDAVFEILRSPLLLENENVKEFINQYCHLLPTGIKYASFLEFLFHITYGTKTRKLYGGHLHWIECRQFKQIESKACIRGKEFEIFTQKHLVTLPPSRHRDDSNFRYSSVGKEKVEKLDGLYDLLLTYLGDCLLMEETLMDKSQLISVDESNKIETNSLKNLNEDQILELTKIINQFYVKGYRNKVALGSGALLFKCGISEQSALALIQRIASDNYDEESKQRASTVKSTYGKGAKVGSLGIAGVTILHEIVIAQLKSQKDAESAEEKGRDTIKKIYRVLGVASKDIDGNDDEQHGVREVLPEEIKEKLSTHIYKIISFDFPIKLMVANSQFKNVVSAFVLKQIIKDEGGKVTNVVYQLRFGDAIIDAYPAQIIIYDNPIDRTRKYEIAFALGAGKKILVIGPASLEDVIAELQLRNKVLKRSSVHDALSAIISAFEETKKAITNDKVTIPGYYIIDGRFIANETCQYALSLSPLVSITSSSNPLRTEIDKINSCIALLEQLHRRWKQGVFSIVIKWAIMAPFSYILKQNNKWIPFLYLYGWSNAGKTTLGKITLSVWRLYDFKTKDEYLLGFTNINSEARFGKVVSRDSYPRVINEVRSLSDPRYANILEMMKNAVENINARGRIEGYRNYVNIPALSPLILTSNYALPDNDTGFKRRLRTIYFDKYDSHQDEKCKQFETWFEDNKDMLGILGDFTASYLKDHLEILTDRRTNWEQKGEVVLKALYRIASKEEPDWINDTIAENTIEESKEEVTTELRSFLINEINSYFIKSVRAIEYQNDDFVNVLQNRVHEYESAIFLDRVRFCIENKVVPYIENYTNKNGESMIAFTSPILREIGRKKVGAGNLNTLRDIANEIPSFNYGTRAIGEKSIKAAYGSRRSLDDFIASGVRE